jgi:hypothetical protein
MQIGDQPGSFLTLYPFTVRRGFPLEIKRSNRLQHVRHDEQHGFAYAFVLQVLTGELQRR